MNGITCRALLNTGAGSSYISSTLARELRRPPTQTDYKQIETMLHTTNTLTDIYDVEITNTKGDFTINTEVSKVDRAELISMPNPHYKDIIQTYTHLQGVQMEDSDNKEYLPAHVMLGASEYANIKTKGDVKVGQKGEPVVEYTTFGWVIIAGSKKKASKCLMLTRSAEADYTELCSLDVLGLKEDASSGDSDVYQRFKDQLGRNEEGWYETNIMWKQFSPALSSKKTGSLGQLGSLLRKLRKDLKRLQQYDEIIRDQLKDSIVERVSDGKVFGKEFYLPHRPLIREAAESNKVRIVFDASAKENDQSPSLNGVTEVGPPLLNKLWNVLIRNRMCPVTLTGDLKQAFLQIRIRKEDRDALRFHWIKSIESNDIETLRFT